MLNPPSLFSHSLHLVLILCLKQVDKDLRSGDYFKTQKERDLKKRENFSQLKAAEAQKERRAKSFVPPEELSLKKKKKRKTT